MENDELEKIRAWFNQVFQETNKIRKQNHQIEDWMEPTYINVKGVYEICENLNEKLQNIDRRINTINNKLDAVLEKLNN